MLILNYGNITYRRRVVVSSTFRASSRVSKFCTFYAVCTRVYVDLLAIFAFDSLVKLAVFCRFFSFFVVSVNLSGT